MGGGHRGEGGGFCGCPFCGLLHLPPASLVLFHREPKAQLRLGRVFPSLQVVGLVTRKDLARYRLGKEGLEELSLAQT